MNPPVIAWGVMLGMSLAVGLLNLVIWVRGLQRGKSDLGFLLFGITALAVVCAGYFEIRLMSLRSPAEATQFLRQGHAAVFVIVVAMALFVHVHLGTGRAWLLGAVLAARVAVLIVNFAGDGNIEHLATTELHTVPFLGGQITVVDQAVPNPWAVVLPLAVLLFIAYVVDASARLWRTGDARQRMRAVRVGGSVVLAVSFTITVNTLKHYGILDWPYVVTPAFLFVVLAVGYELVLQVLRSSELSEQLQASRHELHVSEQRLRMATQAAGIGIWAWDRTRDEFHFSAQALEVLRLGLPETVGTATLLPRIAEDDRATLRAAMESAAVAGELDFDIQLGDGSRDRRWVALRGSHVGDSAGVAPRLRGVLVDVTNRRESDARLNAVAHASPIGIIMVKRDGLITFSNRKVENVFGYEAGELVGKPVDLLVPQSLRDRHASHRSGEFPQGVARAMLEGRDVIGVRKDGSKVIVEVSLVQVEVNGERVSLASVIDQGWRRDAERELATQRDELAYLTRASLLGELSGSLAHELNQPLTAILSNSQAAQQLSAQGRLDKDKLDEILVDIVSDTRRAGDVIQRLRALLRHGRSTMERVDLEAVVREVLRLMATDLMNRGVTVQTTFAPGLPPVFGDRVQLQQVILNLLLNACEAMADESLACQIKIATELDTKGQVRLSVVDDGPGIPEDELKRIFEPFVTTKEEGLGLGLSLCRTIIEHHNGTIQATNNPARGATFDFRLQPAAQPG